jgi:hypothetical protein
VSPSDSPERRVERREEIWEDVFVRRLEYQDDMVGLLLSGV